MKLLKSNGVAVEMLVTQYLYRAPLTRTLTLSTHLHKKPLLTFVRKFGNIKIKEN